MQIQQRERAEAAHIVGVLEEAEKKSADKVLRSLEEQRDQLDELQAAKLRELEFQLRTRFAEELDAYLSEGTDRVREVTEKLSEAHAKELHAKLELERLEYDAKISAVIAETERNAAIQGISNSAERLSELNGIRQKLQALDKVFQWNSQYLQNSHQIHVLSTALLSLHAALADGKSSTVAESCAALRVAARGTLSLRRP